MSAARDFALALLDRAPLPGWPARQSGKFIPEPRDPRDGALAEQLRVGVIKNLLWLQHLIEHHSRRRRDRIDPLVQKILAIGLYQLRFLERIPAAAAVDEAVAQTRRFGRGKAAGLVNAVLRNTTRNPDPEDAPVWLRLSHPAILFQRLLKLFDGDGDDAEALCRRHNQTPPLIVRLMRGRTIDDLRTEASVGLELIPHERTGMVVVQGATRELLTRWASRGIAQPQDPTSADVTERCDVRPGQTVLDRCCGMGTKTMRLAESAGPEGRVFAVDPNPGRCEALRRLLAERAIATVGVIQASWMRDIGDAVPRQFDRVLVDAPCGNSGVLIRRPEARYHQSAGALRALGKLQREILTDTAPIVTPGGKLVYSTCSIWPEENERVVDWFLANHDGWAAVEQATTLPTTEDDPASHHDGGFVAVLVRA